jgi:hypothetical protein
MQDEHPGLPYLAQLEEGVRVLHERVISERALSA